MSNGNIMSKEKDFSSLLKNKKASVNPNPQGDETLAESISKFEKADLIMSNINQNQNLNSESKNEDKVTKIKSVMVTYSLPEEYIDQIKSIIRKCMREEIEINKSEIIRIGIDLVNKLSVEEIENYLLNVKIIKGRPKI